MRFQYLFSVVFTATIGLSIPSAGQGQPSDHKTSMTQAEPGWWTQTVFYEVFVRSFFDSNGDGIGDFQGLTTKLDYLNDGDSTTQSDLGITGIWLMPINASPSYHGYDVTDYKAVEPDYGTMQDFRDFLDAAHARGIKVIMDLVLNHSSSQHPWHIDARNNANGRRNFYRWSANDPGYNGPWGQQVWHNSPGGYYYGLFWGGMPDLNYNEAAVRDSMDAVARFWLEDVGVDGFRLDAIKFIYENGPVLENLPSTIQYWKDFEATTELASANSLTVGEAWTNTNEVVRYVENDGLDLCFEFDLATAMLQAVQSGNAAGLRQKMNEVYTTYPHFKWATFLTNHDINRVLSTLNGDEERNKAAASAYLTLPGVPFIYYGEEIGMLGTKPDPDIRRPMQWNIGAKAGFTLGNAWHPVNSNYPSYNVAVEQADPNSLWHHYRNLVELRDFKPALQRGAYTEVTPNNAAVYAFWRTLPDDTALVVINMGNNELLNLELELPNLGMPGGVYDWHELYANAIETVVYNSAGNLELPLSAYQTKVFALQQERAVQAPEADLNQINVTVFPNPTSESFTVSFTGNNSGRGSLCLFDSGGTELVPPKKVRTGNSYNFDLRGYPAGSYFLVLRSDLGTVAKKVLLQK